MAEYYRDNSGCYIRADNNIVYRKVEWFSKNIERNIIRDYNVDPLGNEDDKKLLYQCFTNFITKLSIASTIPEIRDKCRGWVIEDVPEAKDKFLEIDSIINLK